MIVGCDATTEQTDFFLATCAAFYFATVVLDDMRERFRECDAYFADTVDDVEEYLLDNTLGVPTEREISVLEKDLPVYRALLVRNDRPYRLPSGKNEDEDA